MGLDLAIKRRVQSVPQALAALKKMEAELISIKTYQGIRKIIAEATALIVLLGHVAEVKAQAEDTILVAHRRIGEEIEKVPKATHKAGPKKQITAQGKSVGRAATGISGTSRSRLKKLIKISITDLKTEAAEIRARGKDATLTAVVRELTQGDKKNARMVRERQLGKKQRALPNKRYGVIVADPEWRFEPWSRETGMDRAADNHYPTSVTEVIAARDVPSIAAKDCVLFLWATTPMLPHALVVMAAWGFDYVSNYCWGKDKAGTGYWNREKHELLLIGTRGKIPCPAPGTQWDSLVMAPRRRHSEKPDDFCAMIEEYFPSLPKIELNRRGEARPGWEAWGNEAEQKEAAE